jgi:hypothetical protein
MYGLQIRDGCHEKTFFVIKYHGKIDFSQIFVVFALFIVRVLMVNATFRYIVVVKSSIYM